MTPGTAERPVAAGHRADIQGLRAIAVLMVMAGHAGLPTPGGFTGVDVFFAISGFVITSMLLREWARDGRIDFGQFYLRRLRRLTPALAVTVAVTVVLSALILSPFGPQQVTAMTALGALGLCANVVIHVVTGDYFGASAEVNPLLHIWSLSLEEQFYIFFPSLLALGLVVGRRVKRSRTVALLLVLAVVGASLIAIRLVPATSPLGAYYGPAGRAWEFAVGAAAAFLVAYFERLPRVLAALLAIAGIAGMLASLWLIGPETPFPGKWTFLPVGGALLAIVAGCVPNPLSAALAHRGMVWVGDRSYSLYLWHWPAVVFAKTLWPTTPYVAVAASVVSVVPAMWSYRYVENRFRSRRPTLVPTVRLTAALTLSTALVAGLTAASAQFVVGPGWVSGTIPSAHRFEPGSIIDVAQPCTLPSARTFHTCRESRPGEPVRVAVVGDSHAQHLYPGLIAKYPDLNVALLVFKGPRFFGTAQDTAALHETLAHLPELRVVIFQRGWLVNPMTAEHEQGLSDLAAPLAQRGVKLLWPEDVPLWSFHATQCRFAIAPAVPLTRCEQPATWDRHLRYLPKLQAVAERTPGVSVIATRRYFCTDETCSMLAADGKTVYFIDNDHLGLAGSSYLIGKWSEDPVFVAALDAARRP